MQDRINFKTLPDKSFFNELFLIAIGFLVYYNSLFVPFQLDDFTVIISNPLFRSLKSFADYVFLFQSDPGRFVTHLTFAMQMSTGKVYAFQLHLFNILFHSLNGVLVYRLLSAILSSGPKKTGRVLFRYRNALALCGGLLFLVHPIQTEAVDYLSQRSNLLASFFYLSSILIYISLRKKFSYLKWFAVWIAVLMGSLAKPVFVTLPLAVILYEIYFFDPGELSLQAKLRLWAPYCSAGIFFFGALFLMNAQHLPLIVDQAAFGSGALDIPRLQYFTTELRVLLTYIRLLFFPLSLNADYDFAYANGILDGKVLVSAMMIITIVILAVRNFERNRLLSFGIFWFFGLLLPESSFFPMSDPISEHRVYLAVFGFIVFLLGMMLELGLHPIRARISGLTLIVILAAASFMRTELWRNPVNLMNDAISKSPYKPRPHHQLGLIWERQGEDALARQKYTEALFLNKKFRPSLLRLGYLDLKEGNFPDAEERFKNYLEMEPNDASIHRDLGEVYLKEDHLDLALLQLDKARTLNSRDQLVYLTIGEVYQKMNDAVKARSFYEQALLIEPRSVVARYLLGNLSISLKDYPGAENWYRQAIELDPRYEEAYNALAIALANDGKWQEAEDSFKKVIELNPQYVLGYVNLAHFYEQRGDLKQAKIYLDKAQSLGKIR